MKIIRKTTGIILSALMLLSGLSLMTTAASALESGDFEYTVKDGKAEITGYRGEDVSELVIPDEIDGFKVTSIGRFFVRLSNIEKVTIPEGVKKIKYWAFSDCKKLSEVKLPESLESIGDGAFYKTGIKKITIPAKVKKLSGNPFSMCGSLMSIKVSADNAVYASKKGVVYSKEFDTLVAYPAGRDDSEFTVSGKVKTIGSSAFLGCKKLKKVTFKKGLKAIKSNAFERAGLKSLNLPSTVKKIGTEAFEGSKLKKVSFKGNSKLVMGARVFADCDSLIKVNLPVTKSCKGLTFEYCDNLKTVKISKKIKTIYKCDFLGCGKLREITVPKTVTKIGDNALGFLYEEEEYNAFFLGNLTIKGYKNSAAHKYAKKYSIKFKAIG